MQTPQLSLYREKKSCVLCVFTLCIRFFILHFLTVFSQLIFILSSHVCVHVCVFKSDKGPTHTESKEAPEPTSETTPDETVITIETETESREDESTPSQNWSVTFISKITYSTSFSYSPHY